MNAEYTGQQIAQLRKEKGLTQKALADQLHVTDKAVSKWERGLNFPDLGVIEQLAKALDTTPSYLLGLEDASKEEIVTSFTELSEQQIENNSKEIQKIAWLNLFATVFLTIALSFINIKLQKNGLFYESELLLWVLYIFINSILIGAIYTLYRYKAIKKLETLDFLLIEGVIVVLAIHFGIQLVTGEQPNVFLHLILLAIGSVCVQLFFYRMIKLKIVKAIPIFLSILWAGWGVHLCVGSLSYLESFFTLFLPPLCCCMMTWLICQKKMK